MLHESRTQPTSLRPTSQRVRFFEGDWLIKSNTQRPRPASREEIMMALEDVTHILIKLDYNEGILNTTISDIEMDSAAIPDGGLGIANYVEECSCPVGYSGMSCEVLDTVKLPLKENFKTERFRTVLKVTYDITLANGWDSVTKNLRVVLQAITLMEENVKFVHVPTPALTISKLFF